MRGPLFPARGRVRGLRYAGVAVAMLASVLVIAACGGSDDNGSTLPLDDDERARPARSRRIVLDRQFAAERPESALGRRHDRVRHREQREVLSRGHPRSALALRRRLGRSVRSMTGISR